MLSKEAVEEFKQIYLQTYGKELSSNDAEEQAYQLLRIYKTILKSENDKK